jgi:hypothetical protein
MKRFSAIVTLLFVLFQVRAQTINLTGKVEDAFLKIPLKDVKITVMNADSTVLADSAKVMYFIAGNRLMAVQYYAPVKAEKRDYLIKASLDGYDDVWKRVSVSDKQKNDVEVPTFEMRRMRQVNLQGVVIKGTKVKMYYKGDTLVYDANAFKLPQGSMLDDLIRQMPGVTMTADGEIFVNGRKVEELLLGSRSFMRGNKKVLMENLPYYTVKNIKVYDRQSEMSAALGYDVNDKKYVMDVNLKEEYNHGYIANAEVAAGTDNRWLARAFALRFDDLFRFTLLGNVNNVNESRHIGESGSWTPASMPQSTQTMRSAAMEIDYRSKDGKLNENFITDYSSISTSQQTMQRYEQFLLSGSTPTSLSENSSYAGNRPISIYNTFWLTKPFFFMTKADFSYTPHNGSTHSAFDQWGDTLTASMRSAGMSRGTTWKGGLEAQVGFNVSKKQQQHISIYARMERNVDESQQASRYATWQLTTPQGTVRHNTNDVSNRKTWGFVSPSYQTKLFKDVEANISETTYFINSDIHDFLYHPDTLLLASQLDALEAITDRSNSYTSHSNVLENTPKISILKRGRYKFSPSDPFVIDYDRWNVSLKLPIRHEHLDYMRGAIDTTARQNTVFLNVQANFRNVSKDGKRDIRFNASHNRSSADILGKIAYCDTSTPLVVKLGNPNLKGTVISQLGADYFGKRGAHQQQFHIGTTLNYIHRNTAMSVVYNPGNGVYTYKPMNVKGAYMLEGKFDISRAIDEKRFWTWQSNMNAGLNHAVDHSMLAGETESHVNTVNTFTLHDGTYIQFARNGLSIKAAGDIRLRHSEGKMRDFSTLNALDFQYGISGFYTFPHIKTTIHGDANVYSRRGYGSKTLNTDDFVINASASQPFLKGKLIASVECFDLLHQLSSTQYEVNAQGRTETWYRSLPHYVMLHIVYHWNKNPKKK